MKNKLGIVLLLSVLCIFSTGLISQAVANDDYIIPYSDTQYLTYSDIKYLSKEELALARNEIFARHGHTFDKAKYRNYFSRKWWYTPTGKTNMKNFSKIEQYNINFIKSYE